MAAMRELEKASMELERSCTKRRLRRVRGGPPGAPGAAPEGETKKGDDVIDAEFKVKDE